MNARPRSVASTQAKRALFGWFAAAAIGAIGVADAGAYPHRRITALEAATGATSIRITGHY